MNDSTPVRIVHTTREEWLFSALTEITKHFLAAKYEVPKVRLACGWPSHGGTSQKKRCIGQAWSGESAADGVVQIFISPYLAEVADEQGVLSTLVHEICHAVVGNINKHNKVFGKCARAVGLEGKLTATVAGEKLIAEFNAWLPLLGDYPHAKLDALAGPVKKQTVRMLKMECATCGCVARMAKKWLDQVGPLSCSSHGPMKYELPETDNDEDDNSDSE